MARHHLICSGTGRSGFLLFSLLLAIPCLACRQPAALGLLPATSSGRIEAAVRLPGAARLSLAWRAANPETAAKPGAVQVWLHREDGQGELLRTVPFAAAAPQASVSIDLGA